MAIDSFKKSIPKIAQDENYSTFSMIYLYLGSAYHKLNDKKIVLNITKKLTHYFKKLAIIIEVKNQPISFKPAITKKGKMTKNN